MAVRDDIIAIPDERLRNGEIAADYLVFMDFLDAPKRWWTGWGDFEGEGHTWQGTGDIISVPALPSTLSDTAKSVTFTVQGATSEMMNLALNAQSRVKGRSVVVYQQFFDVSPSAAGVQPWSPLMPAFALWTGKMDLMPLSSRRDEGSNLISTISVTANGLFTNRNAGSSQRWSDSSQRELYGETDRGCERMSIYENYAPLWE